MRLRKEPNDEGECHEGNHAGADLFEGLHYADKAS
jgi:hypothetical protein